MCLKTLQPFQILYDRTKLSKLSAVLLSARTKLSKLNLVKLTSRVCNSLRSFCALAFRCSFFGSKIDLGTYIYIYIYIHTYIHTHTHTHTYIHILHIVCVCVCVIRGAKMD